MRALALGLTLIAAGCSSSNPSDAATDSRNSPLLDSPAPVDAVDPLDSPSVDAVAELDAAPDFSSLVCTGRPIPEGLTCVVQDPAAAGPCDGAGGVVFDGSQCVLARAGDCTGELGAFASLEECGVTCAAAGHCNILNLAIRPEWQAPPQYCGDTPYECPGMGVQRYDRLAPTCAVWGPFSQALVRSEDVPFPGHWDLLYSLSLVRDTLGLVICDPL
jgi:hypothetical protein